MAVQGLITILWQYWPGLLLVFIVQHLLRNLLKPGLREIPGPFLAKFTNLWRFFDVWAGRADETHIALHRKYGDYVRLGPNAISVANLSDTKTIYGINKGYEKSPFYRVQQQLKGGKPVLTLFTSTNEDFHASIKRPVANAYSMTTLTEFEPFVDRTISVFFDRLKEEFIRGEKRGRICDISHWLQFYAFDVIGEITFSRRLGFIDRGSDVDNIIADLNTVMFYNGVIGQIPWLDYLFKKNPILNQLFKPTGQVARFAQARLRERLENPKAVDAPNRDFLDRFIEAKTTHPSIVNDGQVLSYTITNVFAGSDTTAISLRAVLYYTLKTPKVLAKLHDELSSAVLQQRISSPVSWKESQELPYLDAVIKEALRLHPAVGLPLERIVPSAGLRLANGVFLPAGTIVGTSPWVIHRDATIFGANVDSFVPERWLQASGESDANYTARRSKMVNATFTFGSGPRTCIGKNISLLEIYKLMPSLFLNFKVDLLDPSKEWEVRNSWFVGQGSIPVRLELLK